MKSTISNRSNTMKNPTLRITAIAVIAALTALSASAETPSPASPSAQAESLSYESFSGYKAETKLNDQTAPAVKGYIGDWVHASTSLGTQDILAKSAGLSYEGLSTTGGSAGVPASTTPSEIDATNSGHVARRLDSTISATDADNKVLYLSFLFQSDAKVPTTYQMLGLFKGIENTHSGAFRIFDVGSATSGGMTGTQYSYGVHNQYTALSARGTLNAGTHLFIAKFTLKSAPKSDSVQVWIDPTSESSPSVTTSGEDLTWDTLTLSDYSSNSASFDEIRWGTDFTSVTPRSSTGAALRAAMPATSSQKTLENDQVRALVRSDGTLERFVQDGPWIRATLTSAESREVKWGVQFEPAEVQIAMPSAVTQLKAEADYNGVTVSWAADATDSYRVRRNDGIVFETNANSIKDPAIKVGVSYHYQVIAVGWGGIASAPSGVEITPKAPECPPIPPAPTVRLDDLTALEVKNGWGKAIAGKAISGTALRLNGKTYEHGVGAHAPALSVYGVPAGATRFVAVVGVDDAVKSDERASVVFQVYGDVKEMGEKPVLIAESPVLSDRTIRTWAFNLELNTRYKQLRLVVTDADDGRMCDHADWADAGFITKP